MLDYTVSFQFMSAHSVHVHVYRLRAFQGNGDYLSVSCSILDYTVYITFLSALYLHMHIQYNTEHCHGIVANLAEISLKLILSRPYYIVGLYVS